jgi:DNA helicase-2/ATP-dependent DNA helicase PcrA
MEEGIFPGYRSISEESELEEERRLCYVGMTRAKEYLFLTCARTRTIFGSTSCNAISRFLKEVPKEMLEGYEDVFGTSQESSTNQQNSYDWEYGKKSSAVRAYSYGGSSESSSTTINSNGNVYLFKSAEKFLSNIGKMQSESNKLDIDKYKAGTKVYHKKFGEGKINYIEAEGEDYKVDITFEKAGHKRLMAKYALLEILE